MDAVDPVEVVEELARRFLTGDRAGALGLFHPDIRIRQPASLPHGGWHHGHEGVRQMGSAFAQHWDRTIDDPHPAIVSERLLTEVAKRTLGSSCEVRGS